MTRQPQPVRLIDAIANAQSPSHDIGLSEVVELVAEEQRCALAAGDTTVNSSETMLRGVREALAWAELEGARNIDEAAAALERYVTSPDLDRKGLVVAPTLATQHRRRTAIRWLYVRLRTWGLTSAVPTVDLRLPPRDGSDSNRCTNEEVELLTWVAGHHLNTAQPTVLALACCGVSAGEIGFILGSSVDLATAKVASLGSARATARTLQLRPEHVGFVEDRMRWLAREPGWPDIPLAYRGSNVSEHKRSAMASKIIAALGAHAGIGVTVARLNAWAARHEFERTDRVESAALLLGVRSLDTAARAIGYEWRPS